jgi:hypothetical protein
LDGGNGRGSFLFFFARTFVEYHGQAFPLAPAFLCFTTPRLNHIPPQPLILPDDIDQTPLEKRVDKHHPACTKAYRFEHNSAEFASLLVPEVPKRGEDV